MNVVIFIFFASLYFADAQITCNKTMALPGYKNVTLECTRTGSGGANCTRKEVTWSSKNGSFNIGSGELRTYGPLGTMDAKCKISNSTLVATLQIYEVAEIHFNTTFTVKFNISNDVKEESVILVKKGDSSNITIDPLTVEAMLRETVTLDCRVSTRDMRYNIDHPVLWSHISSSGPLRQISIAFYLQSTVNTTRFNLSSGNTIGSPTDYSYKLNILGVMDEDDGKFVCEHTSNDSTISRKEVPFTVLHDIESLTLEVRIANQTLTSNRTIHPKEPSMFETEVRSCMVTCVVNGSNPQPVVNLRVGENVLSVQPNVTSRLVGSRRAYEVKVMQNVSLAGYVNKSVVDVTCEAKLLRNRFPLRSAGIRLDVQPAISAMCKNPEPKEIGENVTISCLISANRTGLDCSKVTLTNATGNEVLTKVGVDSDTLTFGPMRFNCVFLPRAVPSDANLKLFKHLHLDPEDEVFLYCNSYSNGLDPISASETHVRSCSCNSKGWNLIIIPKFNEGCCYPPYRTSSLDDGTNVTILNVTIIVYSLREVHFSTGLYLRYSSGDESTTTKLNLFKCKEESLVRATCHTVFANIGERDVTAVCDVTTPDCSSIRWEGKWQGTTLAAMERRVDDVLGVLESACMKLEGNTGIKAVLKISNITEAIFQANIYMSYNNGVEPVRVSIQIEKRGTNSPHGNSGTEPSERAIFVLMTCAVISVLYA